MRPRRLLRSVALLGMAPVVLTGCGIAGASDGETVRVYSGRHYDLEQAFERFAEETDVNVEFLFGSDAELRERIKAEGTDTQADVYMTVDAGNLHLAAAEGMFRPIQSDILDEAVPANLRDPEGRWFGLSKRARTIVYHPDRVDPSELSTYEDLADPRWQGRLCMRSSSNVYTQSLVASLIATHGYDEAKDVVSGWVANGVQILGNDVLILETLAEGGCDVAVANHYYLARLLEENPEFPARLAWANQDDRGVHVNVSGAGITRHADNPDLAAQLLEWLATDGQSAFVDGNHEYPVNPDVEPEPLIAGEFGTDFATDDLNAAEFGSLNAEAIRLMAEAGYR